MRARDCPTPTSVKEATQMASAEQAPVAPSRAEHSGFDLRALLSVWLWFEFTAVSMLAFLLAAILAPLVGPFDRNRAVVGTIVRLAAVATVKLNPLWKFRIHGPLPQYRPRRTVCVSNHCSHTDPLLIYHLPWNIKWLAKSSLFRIPFLGWAMWLAGHVPVQRGKPQSAKLAMKRCAEFLGRGAPIVIFPEGTRSTSSEMLPFRDGAFRLAIETGADLLPMAVAGTGTALRKHDWKASYSRGFLTVGTPVSTEGMTLDDLPALKQRMAHEIQILRERIRLLASE
jgi:1-acyl-sn-glycerol-3-phosphate acyltransferase